MKFGEKLFQTKLLSRLSHNVCRLRSSSVLLRKFSNEKREARTLRKRDQESFKAILHGQIIKKGERKNAHCSLTDTLFPVWWRSLVTRKASTRIASIIVYAAVFTPSLVECTLVTVDRLCVTPVAIPSPVGRGWIVTVSVSCFVATWAWRQFPRGWLPGSPMAIPWG